MICIACQVLFKDGVFQWKRLENLIILAKENVAMMSSNPAVNVDNMWVLLIFRFLHICMKHSSRDHVDAVHFPFPDQAKVKKRKASREEIRPQRHHKGWSSPYPCR